MVAPERPLGYVPTCCATAWASNPEEKKRFTHITHAMILTQVGHPTNACRPCGRTREAHHACLWVRRRFHSNDISNYTVFESVCAKLKYQTSVNKLGFADSAESYHTHTCGRVYDVCQGVSQWSLRQAGKLSGCGYGNYAHSLFFGW